MSTRKFDVVIVGAGPAGSLAAFILARAGHSVALLDRSIFPRAKVCGDCLNPNCWPIWQRYGLVERFAQLPHQTISGFSLELRSKLVFRKPFPSVERSVERATLDAWLCEEAQEQGAVFFSETIVTAVDCNGLVTTTEGTFQGSFVLGADGRNSIVARTAGLSGAPKKCNRVAWKTDIKPGTLDNDVHLNVFDVGYCGINRTGPETATLCFVLDTRSGVRPQEVARRFFPDLPERPWQSVHPITRPSHSPGQGRTWLAGDAARVLEPFTGEGIYYALATGEAAALAMLAAMRKNNATLGLSLYNEQRRRIYGNRIRINSFISWSTRNPHRGARILGILRHWPWLISALFNQLYAPVLPGELPPEIAISTKTTRRSRAADGDFHELPSGALRLPSRDAH